MNKSAKKIIIILSIIIALLLLLFIGFSYWMGNQIVEASTHLITNEKTMQNYKKFWEEENFDFDKFSSDYKIEKTIIKSTYDNHELPFDTISKEGNKDIVVMAHGLGGNRFTNYPTAETFLRNGYNVISYDQRSSGENYAESSTFGYMEKFDLIDCINYAKKTSPDAKIVVWGESFGGATAVQAVAHEDVQNDVYALIADCPVSSMAFMTEEAMRDMEIPIPMEYLMFCGNTINKIKLGFSYEDADSALCAEKIKIPALIINSKADKTTPYFMGKDIYDNLSSEKKELFTSETSAHTKIRNDEKETYTEKILEFIK